MIRPHWELEDKSRAKSAREVIEILLKNRGAGPSFFNCALKGLEPHLNIRGMNTGAELMAHHIAKGHKVVLAADYDCDGVTSAAQMSLFFRDIGYTNYEVIIPNRSEGYGMPERAVVNNLDARLFVHLDCGSIDERSVALAAAAGADTLVIDHHEIPEGGAAPATVLINPKQTGCPSQFKEFSSAGLTLLFLTRLRKALADRFPPPRLGGKYLSLAAVGTVADMVPLVEGNRILVRHGLSCINRKLCSPLQGVVQAAGLSGRTLTAGLIGYYVGPRINAAGRVADARIAFDLLTAEEPEEILRLARELNRLNVLRQTEEDRVLKDVRSRFEKEKAMRRTLVMADPRWPVGVVGIVAAKIQQNLLYGPAIVFSIDESGGVARGSGRSVPGFDMHAAVRRCEDLLLKWGGHKMAVGMTISLERIGEFSDRFEQVAQEHPASLFFPRARVDMELDLALVSSELVEHLKEIEPYGMGNPTPVFAARGIRVSPQKTFGREQSHLRLLAEGRVGAVYWKGAARCQANPWKENDRLDMVFQLDWDDYLGEPLLNVKDIGRLFPPTVT